MAAKTKDDRKRNFACTVWPDSAPVNWQNKLSNLKVPGFISPCHDKDVYDEEDEGVISGDHKVGELKKAHWHVMLMFEGKKNDEQVRELFQSFGGVGLEKLHSVRGMARYLCHLDDKNKARYNTEDVISLAGADYYTVIELPEEKYIHIAEIMEFCVENEITSFSELSIYACIHRKDWFRILVDKNTTYIREFLKSRHYDKVNNSIMRIDDKGNLLPYPVDRRTGEALE